LKSNKKSLEVSKTLIIVAQKQIRRHFDYRPEMGPDFYPGTVYFFP